MPEEYTHTHTHKHIYLIKQYRHPLSTHLVIYPFESSHQFYGIQRELFDKSNKIGSLVLSARSLVIVRGVYIGKAI